MRWQQLRKVHIIARIVALRSRGELLAPLSLEQTELQTMHGVFETSNFLASPDLQRRQLWRLAKVAKMQVPRTYLLTKIYRGHQGGMRMFQLGGAS